MSKSAKSSSSSSRERVTDSLLQPGRGTSPAFGINEDSETDTNSVSVTHTKERIWTVALFSIIACIGSLIVGLSLGYSTNTLSELSDLYHNGDHEYGVANGSLHASLFGAFGPLGALFGAPVAWPLSETFGRKPALLFSTIPGLIGWVALSVSNLLPSKSGFLAFFYAGRLLSGFAAGWMIFCVSVYITEISTPKLRGVFGNCNQLFITIGIFLVEALGYNPEKFLTYTDVSLIAAAIVTIFAFLLLFVPETPSWLYKKGKDLEGNLTLNFLRGSRANVPNEINGIKSVLENSANFTILDQLKSFRHRPIYLPFILVFCLMFFQQFSGINAGIFYSTQIFENAKVQHSTLVTLLAVGLVQIFATFVSVLLIDFLGRKKLLVISSTGMLLSSASLGVYFLIFDHYCNACLGDDCYEEKLAVCHHTAFGGLAIASVVVFIVTFSLGWGPIPWLMMSELVPLRSRGLSSAIATFFNWTFAFVITIAFTDYAQAVTPKFAWWSFSIIMLVSIPFVLFLLPETKGKKLDEIERHFERGQVLYNPFKRERH